MNFSILLQYWRHLRYLYIGMYLLKVKSDDAAAPRPINVLVFFCWVWASCFSVTDLNALLYVVFCFMYLVFISIFPRTQIHRQLPQWKQFSNILRRYDAVRRLYAQDVCTTHYSLFQICFRVVTTVFLNSFIMCRRISYYALT